MMTGSFDIGFTTLKQEIVSDALPVRGALPAWLSGTLLRTGPAQFEVGNEHYPTQQNLSGEHGGGQNHLWRVRDRSLPFAFQTARHDIYAGSVGQRECQYQ